jgi:acetyltransferase-like isoleucine patch superfamily enzyme
MLKKRLRMFLRERVHNSPWNDMWQHHRMRELAAPETYFVNFIFQRIFGVNHKTPWPVHYTSTVLLPERIKIGRNVDRSFALSGGCYFQGWNGIVIGENTIFAPGVKIMSANHEFGNLDRLTSTDPLVIGNNCWLGANALIMPGVRIGDNVIVGAGTVVTHSFPDRVILAGVPARIIRENNPNEA